MKKVIITGSTRGIGFGLADAFLACGCSVVVNSRSQTSVDTTLSQLAMNGMLAQGQGQIYNMEGFGIIADTVDNVAPWLVDKMLANTKNGACIVYAPPIKLAGRFISAPFTKRNVFEE